MTTARRTWHVLTGEFPPACGGVGDYAALLSGALAARGDCVHVWTPANAPAALGSVVVHRLPDTFGPRSRDVLSDGIAAAPGILLVQYVPNALGRRGANLAFCRWLLSSRRAGADVRVMFHEPYFYFTAHRPWRNALAVAQRVMARTLLRAAADVYLSSETWRRYLAPYGDVSAAITLPIPSTLPEAAAADVDACRRSFCHGDAPLIAHFGTYGEHVGGSLGRVLPRVLEACPAARVVLAGAGSDRFLAGMPDAATRAVATGWLPPERLAAVLKAADLVMQPYPDGVTTRRTSVMAALCNGSAVVTTDGALTEAVWRNTRAAALVRADDPRAFAAECSRLLTDRTEREAQRARARAVYHARFSLERTLTVLGVPGVAAAAG